MAQKQKSRFRKPLSVLIIIIFALVFSCFLYWYFSLSAPNLPKPPLKDLAASHDIKLGSRTILKRLDDRIYPDIVTSQFSFITIVEEAHFDLLLPSPGKYNFNDVDRLMAFANDHTMPIQIYHLVWGEEHMLPDWLKNGNYNKDQLLDIVHNYISNVAGHFKGKVAEWSVVNEAFTRAQHIYGLNDWWADHLGKNTRYIDDSFIWAHKADPNAKLLLNDFNNEAENSVSDDMYNYIKVAKARGVPIDGLGMQMHINAAKPPSKEAVIKNMQRFGAIGVPTYVTEFDVNLNSVKGNSAYKNHLESQITYNMVRACIESKTCVSFVEFGTTDKEDLLKRLTHADSRSYLFDSRFRPKPSFYSFRQAWLEP